MYNDRRYSFTRFSLNRENRTVEIRESFSEVMNAVAGAAVPVDFRGCFSETVRTAAMGAVAVVSSFSVIVELKAAAHSSANAVSRAAFAETIHGAAYGGTGSGGNSDGVYIICKKYTRCFGACGRAGGPDCRFKKYPGGSPCFGNSNLHDGGNVPDHRADSGTTDNPAGRGTEDKQRAFLVLLNGENVLHTQSGDWVNISRNLLRIIIESAPGGNLRGPLIYTERYL